MSTSKASATPAQWPHWSAQAAGAGRLQPGLPSERQWHHGSQPAPAHARPLWPRSQADQAHRQRSCDQFLRSQRQRLGSWQGRSGLSGNTFEGAGSDLVAGLSGNRNATRAVWMFELPMTATCGDTHPACSFQSLDHVADLQRIALDGSQNHCLLHEQWFASVQSPKPDQETQP